MYALQYHSSCNVDWTPDPSHGGNIAFWDALKKADLLSHELGQMFMWGVRHGPWNEAVRWQQTMECIDEHFTSSGPKECALFQNHIPNMS